MVSKTTLDGPGFLAITGTVGVGKTHLAAAAMKYVTERGKNVLFIKRDDIASMYQKMLYNERKSNGDFIRLIDECASGSDLVIFDDFDSRNTIIGLCFENVFKHVLRQGKSLFLTSNNEMHSLFQSVIPLFFNNHSLVILHVEDLSMRIPWTDTIIGIGGTAAVEMLVRYDGSKPAGIVLLNNAFTTMTHDLSAAHKMKGILREKYNIEGKTIGIAKQPYLVQDKTWPTVYDLFVLEAGLFAYFIITVVDDNQAKQLMHLVSSTFDLGQKIIVLSDDANKLRRNVERVLGWYPEKAQGLRERFGQVLPGLLT